MMGFPPIDGKPLYIDEGCNVETLLALNLDVYTKMSNNEKNNQIIAMMGKYVNKNH